MKLHGYHPCLFSQWMDRSVPAKPAVLMRRMQICARIIDKEMPPRPFTVIMPL